MLVGSLIGFGPEVPLDLAAASIGGSGSYACWPTATPIIASGTTSDGPSRSRGNQYYAAADAVIPTVWEAYRSVLEAANEALRNGVLKPGANGILPSASQGAILQVNGVNVQLIGGRVIDGVVHLGSFAGWP